MQPIQTLAPVPLYTDDQIMTVSDRVLDRRELHAKIDAQLLAQGKTGRKGRRAKASILRKLRVPA